MVRRLVVAAFVAALAFSMVACGGGEDTAAEPEAPAEAAPPPAAAPPAASGGLSPDEPQEFEPFPTDPAIVPAAILQRLEAKQPMIVYFYDSQEKATDDQSRQIDAVMQDNRGLIDLVGYDLGKFARTDESGQIVVDPSLASTTNVEVAKATVLAESLGVSYMPYMVLVDDQGYITWRFRGYTDSQSLSLQVQRATQ